jgi:hypothetical protein
LNDVMLLSEVRKIELASAGKTRPIRDPFPGRDSSSVRRFHRTRIDMCDDGDWFARVRYSCLYADREEPVKPKVATSSSAGEVASHKVDFPDLAAREGGYAKETSSLCGDAGPAADARLTKPQ